MERATAERRGRGRDGDAGTGRLREDRATVSARPRLRGSAAATRGGTARAPTGPQPGCGTRPARAGTGSSVSAARVTRAISSTRAIPSSRAVTCRGRRRGRRSTAHGAEPSLMWGRLGRGCGLLPLLAVVLLHLRAPSRGRGCAPRALRHRHHHLTLRHHHRHRSVRSRLLRPSLLRLARVLLHDRHVHHLVRPRRWVLVPRRLVSLPGRAVGCEPGALRWIHDTAPARPVEWGAARQFNNKRSHRFNNNRP